MDTDAGDDEGAQTLAQKTDRHTLGQPAFSFCCSPLASSFALFHFTKTVPVYERASLSPLTTKFHFTQLGNRDFYRRTVAKANLRGHCSLGGFQVEEK